MRHKSSLIGVLVIAVCGAAPARGQDASIGTDVGFFSSYVWRGLTLTNKFVIEPEAYVSAYGFSGGFWFNIEPAKYNDPNDISESGGVKTSWSSAKSQIVAQKASQRSRSSPRAR